MKHKKQSIRVHFRKLKGTLVVNRFAESPIRPLS